MFLLELFGTPDTHSDDDNDQSKTKDDGSNSDFIEGLRQTMIDELMPLASSGVPFVTIQQVIDKLQQQRSGLVIDRNVVMQVLDPDQVKLITKIEGDKIFFKLPDPNSREVDQQQKQNDIDKTKQAATAQATKSVTDKNGPLG